MREEIASYESVFRDTNAKTVKISTLLANHVSWTKLFRTLEGATPEGVLYTHLLTKNDYTITLNGTAANREALLLLQKNLNESGCFQNADVPLSNMLVKENIDFQLNAIMQKSCLSNHSE